MRSRILDHIKDQVEAEGYAPGTPNFANRLLVVQVEKCQELRGNPCPACRVREDCVLAQRLYRLITSQEKK